MNTQQNEEMEIDILHLIKVLWQKLWIIVLAAVICAGAGFAYAKFMITPLYQANVLVYVNNSSFNVGSTSFSISSSSISAGRQLVDVYTIILKTRRTLDEVIERANLPYSYGQLAGMVSASDVNSTEIFKITVTNSKPEECALIANTIAEVLPDKIAEIVDGASVRIVEKAVVPTGKVSPSLSRYAMMGLVLGIVASCAIIIIVDLMDDTIKSDEYILQTYDLPILSSIPSFGLSGKKGYYKRYGGYGNYSNSAVGTAGASETSLEGENNIDNNLDNVD